jgi:hypothetical protein
MLIAARFSGSGSGKDPLSRATSLIAFGLLPFSSFPSPVARDAAAAAIEALILRHDRPPPSKGINQAPLPGDPQPMRGLGGKG